MTDLMDDRPTGATAAERRLVGSDIILNATAMAGTAMSAAPTTKAVQSVRTALYS
jgi:hypothetical protein